ncbi:MAG: SDR family oxidoreductase [Hyphomonadaceae bacterium]|nr:SDR family oxidoreductase [Hyphomonadaceae bacterium]
MDRKLFDLDGRCALVTGGSRGLGLQIAEALGAYGARLVITARKEAELAAAAEHLKARGVEVAYATADMTREDDIARIAAFAQDALGRIDILVNNAGASWGAPTEDHPLDAWDKIMNLNVRALFVLSQQVARLSMIPNRYGRIINMSSMAGLRGADGLVAYNTSKGAVINFTRALAASWGKYGVTANAIAPGMFATRMTKGTFERVGVERFANAAPLGRIGDAEDLKGAVLLFASDAGKHITGQTLAVDGGVTAV